jgi:predicted MPP superfamily phosphohydrolase
MRNYLTFGVAMTVILGLLFAGHWVIYRALIHFWNIKGAQAIFKWRIVFAILSLSFIVMSILTSMGYSEIGRWMYNLSAVWIGTMYWLLIASVLSFVFAYIVKVSGLSIPMMIVGKALLILGLLISAYGILHSYDTQVTHYTVELPNLPAEWENKNIAMVADTHLGNVRGLSFSKKISSLIAAQKPEMVLIAGDFFDGPPAKFEELAAPFGQMNIPKGVFFANGNHEEYSTTAKYDDAIAKAGVTVLSDQSVDVSGIQIIGVNYSTTTNENNNTSVLNKIGVDSSKPSILIKHVPNTLSATEKVGIDLQVSGHTHGGQVWPGLWLTNKIYKGFAYGNHKLGNMNVITTSGAGTWGPPQRVGATPEIVIITLKNKTQ